MIWRFALLAVQQFLANKSLTDLKAEYGIVATSSPCGKLVALNYSQLDSDKRKDIVRECRGLVLEQGSWRVAARSFPRFFNAGECPDLEAKFDWSSFSAEDKEDGSLILLYFYDGYWRVNTRGSFATGEIMPGCGSWEKNFREAIGNETAVDELNRENTYVFEFCSRMNQVVRQYDKPTIFLLSAFHNKTGTEVNEQILDWRARALGVKRPARHSFSSLREIQEYLEAHDDPTYEGLVLRDRRGMRLKCKSSRYLALHHMFDNGNLGSPKRILSLVLKGEASEVITLFPNLAGRVFDMVAKVGSIEAKTKAVWEAARGIQKQKDFALFVTAHAPVPSVLFEARKHNKEPKQVMIEMDESLLKYVEVAS